MTRKLKIAVTGGIGSGKSLFCSFLQDSGLTVISADRLAGELLAADPQIKEKIIASFGKASYRDGKPDTKFIASKVFASAENLATMNSIVHPVVIREVKRRMKEVLKSQDFVAVEAALIYEAQMEEMFDYVVLVTADEEIRIKRAAERIGASEEDVRRRNSGQIPEEQKQEWADFTFRNDGSPEDLKKKADFFLTLLKTIGGQQN